MRLIDADALIQKRNHAKAYAPDMYVIGQGYVMDAPTVDAVPVVRGEWKPIFKGADTCECSVCKSKGFSDSDFGFIATPYCPNCGAKMDN